MNLYRRYRQFRLYLMFAIPWLKTILNLRHYRKLNASELHSTRKSNTLFIFGSGYSINDISPYEWAHFEQHDTMSFNWFVYQNWVQIDYHLIREVMPNDFDPMVWRPKIHEYTSLILNNPNYASTIFLLQGGWVSNGNRLLGMKSLPKQARIFRFNNSSRGEYKPPSSSFSDGLVHGPATLVDCINFAYILGWKQIVLVGVDLYDRRYFWLGYDETRDNDMYRGASHRDRHNSADALIPFLGRWRELLLNGRTELYVYNPRSLLADVLPIYQLHEPDSLG